MRRGLTLLLGLLTAGLLAVPALANSFAIGRYHGSTSQKHKIVFRVRYTAQCTSATYGRRTLCLSQPATGSAVLDLTCSDGSNNVAVESVQAAVPRSGRLRVKLSTGGAVTGTMVVILVLHKRGTITGSLTEKVVEAGSNASCASGKVTFSAKR